MEGIQTFLNFLNTNWTTILVLIGLVAGIIIKVKEYFGKTKEERLEIAKKQIQEIILKLISDAEEDYEEWEKAGSIKRAQVIEQIFEMYPILSRIANQQEIIEWLDELIDESLETLKNVITGAVDEGKREPKTTASEAVEGESE